MLSSVQKLGFRQKYWVFKLDNDSKHISKGMVEKEKMDYFKLGCDDQSRIETLCRELKPANANRTPPNLRELECIAMAVCQKLPAVGCKKLRWLQEMSRSCHCCQRFCDQILVKGANNRAQCTFYVYFKFHYLTAFLLLLFKKFGHFIKYYNYTKMVHLHLFVKIFYILYLQLGGVNNPDQASTLNKIQMYYSAFVIQVPTSGETTVGKSPFSYRVFSNF